MIKSEKMKQSKKCLMATIMTCGLALLLLSACGSNNKKEVVVKNVCGIMENPADSDSVQAASDSVRFAYDVQQALCQRLGYTTEGEDMILYIDGEAADTIRNTITDMGGFDDDAIWIGEKLYFEKNDGDLRVSVVPGVKFVVGLVLHYENMPTITATVGKSNEGTVALSDLKIE